MNILVTGGNGFLGSNLVRKLVTNNHNVYVLSRSNVNLSDILFNIKFDFCENENLILYKKSIQEFQPDVILHFGWSGGNNYNDVNNILQFHDNVQSSIRLIDIIKSLTKKTKFIGIGSFAEYGMQTDIISETATEMPLNLYGLSKLTFKRYSEMLCKQFNIDWVWLRPCYVYGPRDVSTRLIPTLITKFLTNQSVNLDSCNTIIDYIYIDDFTDFVYNIAISNNTGVFNVCSGNEYNLKDIVYKIHNLTNSNSDINFDISDQKITVSKYICGDNSKIKQATNSNCKTDLETGLLTTINFIKNEKTHDTYRTSND